MDESMIGLRLDGRYEITEKIGEGGMSDVYCGRDVMENRIVAVKILKQEYSGNEEFVRFFRNESKAIAVLSHPNIVKIFDVGHEQNLEFIVMEYIDGITLKEYIEQVGIVPWRECVHYSIQILRALQLAHDRGIVHRDIKPQNVMRLSDGTIKVMDFGIARFSRQAQTNSPEKTMGSVHYVSPEQARGENTDERSDIYSVGVIMYEMLTGRKPFDGETPVSVALKHMNEAVVPPSEYSSSIYKGLEEIVLHAMEKQKEMRYQSATMMIGDIEAFKNDQSVVFGYTNEPVKRFDKDSKKKKSLKSSKKAQPEPENEPLTQRQDFVEDVIDDEDYDEPRHNYIIPILCATMVTVILVATFFLSNVVLSKLKTAPSSSNDYTMPKLTGENYYDARAKYPNIQLVATEEFNSEYPSGIIISQEKAEGRTVKIGAAIKVVVSKGTRIVTVPDVVNYHYNSASAALNSENLNFLRIEIESDDIAAGYVVKTDPAAFSSVEEGSTVKLYVSIGPSTEDTIVPHVVGKTVGEAEDMLLQAFLVPKIQYVESVEEKDLVLSQNIVEGDVVTRGTTVTVYVSDGTGIVSDPFGDDNEVDLNDNPGVFPPSDLPENTDDPDGNTPEQEHQGQACIVLRVDIPANANRTYTIVINNVETSTAVSDNIFFNASSYAGAYIEIPIYGNGKMEVSARLRSPRSGMITELAQYDIDFDDGTGICKNYSTFAFSLVDMNGGF